MEFKLIELQYIKLLNDYFCGAEALQIAQTKCRNNHIYRRQLVLLQNNGYGEWLKEVFPREFKLGILAYAQDFDKLEKFLNEKVDINNEN